MPAILLFSFLLADGGEMYLGVGGALELQHFAYSPVDGPQTSDTTLAFGGRLTTFARYGLSDTLHIGAGFTYVLTPSLDFADVAVGPYTGLLYTKVSEFVIPLSAAVLLDWGYDWNVLLTLEGGISHQRWTEIALVDSSHPDPAGNYPRFPVDPSSQRYTGISLGLAVETEWRALDWLVLDMGPAFVMTSGPGAWHWHLSLAVRMAYVFGLGPSWDF